MSSDPSLALVDALLALAGEGLPQEERGPWVIGICGAQGCGKTTLARAVATRLEAVGRSVAILSLDDLYLSRARREELARSLHPLFLTRGVPGTHDVDLGLAIFAALDRGEAVALPRFDKGTDDRIPPGAWPVAPEGCEVVLFEGWCVGAMPQAAAELSVPVNGLERLEDADGRWRAHANSCLGTIYQRLFARIDRLVLLAAPDFGVVRGWRLEQERELARSAPGAPWLMDDAAISRFIQFYQRLTEHILREMPSRADLVVHLDDRRRPVRITRRDGTAPAGPDGRTCPFPETSPD